MVMCKPGWARVLEERGGNGIMDENGEHHVARIDETVTAANVHERAEAVAVPDFNYLEQTVGRRQRSHRSPQGRPLPPTPGAGRRHRGNRRRGTETAVIALVPDQGASWPRVAAGQPHRQRRRCAGPHDSGAGHGSSRQALVRLRDGAGAVTVVAAPDGRLKWQLVGGGGVVIAESPGVYRDAARCRAAFTDAPRPARAALGGSCSRPLATSM
jgi:hypothetical protein